MSKMKEQNKDYDYDHEVVYPDEKTFTINGKVLNSISTVILNLEKQIKDAETDVMLEELEELRLRDKNPSLKDAWDQYQVVLGLTRKR